MNKKRMKKTERQRMEATKNSLKKRIKGRRIN